ncbi:Protein of unknown function [Paenibacillus sp. 1_12]|uniref:Z-ring formation inhibitor MciZ n=1 Tax=Paenibacillus sp. 1_12 TaxID=1566278 RepID=UPI0008EF32E0|nr:Z-ring formation inhibitor MciZ [Paenibacillus sp. 1_12]SFK93231.1 Protein of unknown function [Paenibacillus sp. 1_12]
MKTYVSEKQISMVGQVWEIRRYLELAQQKRSEDTSLLTYLAEQTDYAHTAASTFGSSKGFSSESPASNPMQPPQPSLFLQNM